MADNRRRRAAATATVGGAATFGGGVLRHKGIRAAHDGGDPPSFTFKHPVKTHPTRALLRPGAAGRKRYLVGATLGLVGAPALAVGGHDYFVRKADQRDRGFVREGLSGAHDALNQRASSMKEAPPSAKAGPFAVGVGTGALGSLAAHRTLDRFSGFQHGRRGALRAGITALAGTAAAAGSLPLSRHATRGGYVVTPAGVRRKKKTPVRPSSKAKVFDQKKLGRSEFRRQTVGKAHKESVGFTGTRRFTPDKHMPAVNDALNRLHPDHHRIVVGGAHGADIAVAREAKRRGFEVHTVLPAARHHPSAKRYSDTWEVAPRKGSDSASYMARNDRIVELSDRMIALTPHTTEERRSGTWSTVRRARKAHKQVTIHPLVSKADYAGRHASAHEQRAKTMAAGAIPGIPFAGPLAAAHVAGHYAPPGEKRKAEGRQLASSAATTATGVGGAYLAASNSKAGDQAIRLHRGMQRVGERLTRPIRSRVKLRSPGGNRLQSVKTRGNQRAQQALARSGTLRRATAPLRHNKPAAVAGYIAGAKLTGTAYQNIAISRNHAAQQRYDLKHPVTKAADPTGMSVRQQRELIQRKRRSATTGAITGTLGLAGAGMGAALLPGVRGRLKPKHLRTLERGAIGTGLAAGGISGVHSIRAARLAHHELDAQERALAQPGIKAARALEVVKRLQELHKADRQPLTRMREDQAHHIVRQYGTAGPLPKELSREDRMRAYEARYVHAGGHKAEHWQHRADIADKIKTGGLAGATAAGGAILGLRHPRVARRLGANIERAKHAADTAAIGAATVSGAGELYAGHARRRRSSYSNSKAGVAASALRRMKDYSG